MEMTILRMKSTPTMNSVEVLTITGTAPLMTRNGVTKILTGQDLIKKTSRRFLDHSNKSKKQ